MGHSWISCSAPEYCFSVTDGFACGSAGSCGARYHDMSRSRRTDARTASECSSSSRICNDDVFSITSLVQGLSKVILVFYQRNTSMAAAQSSVRMAMGIARRSHGFRLSSPAIPNQNQAFTSTGPWRIVPRAYSAVPTEAVEPPEFLSEGERKIFERIKEGLKPTKLEVRTYYTRILKLHLTD